MQFGWAESPASYWPLALAGALVANASSKCGCPHRTRSSGNCCPALACTSSPTHCTRDKERRRGYSLAGSLANSSASSVHTLRSARGQIEDAGTASSGDSHPSVPLRPRRQRRLRLCRFPTLLPRPK